MSQKELFRSLILSIPFEIDYTTIDSRRIPLWKYDIKEERWNNLPSHLIFASFVLYQKKPERFWRSHNSNARALLKSA